MEYNLKMAMSKLISIMGVIRM